MPHIKKTITEAAGLPREVTLNLPLVTISGRDEIIVENHKSLLWADSETAGFSSSCGILKIQGKDLCLREISSDYIKLSGALEKLEFLI